MLKAKTLIKRCILLKKVLNTKISEFIHLDVALFLAIISFDLKLVCNFCEFLSKEWSATTQIQEQKFCITYRITIFVEPK